MDYFAQRPMVSMVVTGVLLGLSFPPFNLPFLIIPAFALLLQLADNSDTYRALMAQSYIAFLIWNIITTYWLMLATITGGVAAILANSVLMTIPLALTKWVRRRSDSPWLNAILTASLWVIYEYLHHHWDLSWPWLTLGNAWAVAPPLVQFISLTGFWGISFWMVISASLFYDWERHSRGVQWTTVAAVIFIVPILSSSIWFYRALTNQAPRSDDSTTATIGVIQPNFDSYLTYGGFPSSQASTQHLLDLTDSLRAHHDLDAVYFPENAIEPRVLSYAKLITSRMLESYVQETGIPIVGGTTYYDYFQNEEAPPLVRKNSRGQTYLYYNSAVAFIPQKPMEVYKKAHLVPIVERTPFLPFLSSLPFPKVDWSSIHWYGKGLDPTVFTLANKNESPPIAGPALVCYDSIYPHWNAQMVNRGATFIGIITNDGWWGHTSGHIQHFQFARLRAIELDRWIVRSANNGISGFIDPLGRIAQQSEYWSATAMAQSIELKETKTLYARWGDWLPYTSMGLILLFAISQISNRQRNKN
jgi:apolipoprotein N-acyltransferase